MSRTRGRVLGAVSALLLAASPWFFACGSGSVGPPEPAIPRAQVDEAPRRDASIDDFLPWAEEQSEMLVVDKTTRALTLYRHGTPVKTYAVVLGRNSGRKAFEGDRRTPSGLYRITGKRVHPKYDRFLAIDYPNDSVGDRYSAASSGARGGAVLGQSSSRGRGGQIGIHGSDNEDLNRLGINWTFGCVSLANRDVEDLYQQVEQGALVMIFDDRQP